MGDILAKAGKALSGKVLTQVEVSRDLGSAYGSIFDYADFVRKVLLQPDGKLVLVGRTSRDSEENGNFALVRYKADGSLDTTFGAGGKAVSTEGGFVQGASLLPDGKFLVAARVFSDPDYVYPVVARFKKDGSLDTSFGDDGILAQDDGTIDLLADGKFLTRRFIEDDGQGSKITLARYDSNGSLDTSFGKGGSVTIQAADAAGSGGIITIQPDGKIVLSGSVWDAAQKSTDFVVARYNADGSPDANFAGGGATTTSVGKYNDTVFGSRLQSDGKILLYGASASGRNQSDSDFAIVRYNADGSLDKTFGKGGKVIVAVGKNDDIPTDMVLQSDGKILLGGSTYDGMFKDFAIIRLDRDGTLDRTFGGDGKVTTSVGPFNDRAASIALQPDGRIVLAGESGNDSQSDFAIVRYNADGSLDKRFGAEAVARTLGENETNAARLDYYDGDGDRLVWSVTGGPDAARFAVDRESGRLFFKSAPDFEAPGDGNRDNVYTVTVKISDGKSTNTETLNFRIADAKSVIRKGNSGNDVLNGAGDGDKLYGAGGNDRIDGRNGNDQLTGGKGRDTFVFSVEPNGRGNVDAITDFSHRDDAMELSRYIFGGSKLGTLEDYRFKVVSYGSQTKGVDKSDRILYDKDDGDLFFDRDGSLTKYKPVKFAEVKENIPLDHTDFLIV